LILKGHYKIKNCPKQIIQVHSIVLVSNIQWSAITTFKNVLMKPFSHQAQDMERESSLLLENKSQHSFPESTQLNTHTVFVVNQNTNNIISKRRAKVIFKIQRSRSLAQDLFQF
jgi:hypothetical protein